MNPTFWWAAIAGAINGLLVWVRAKPEKEPEKKKKKREKKNNDDPWGPN